jgi:uncharacterized protein (DUF983 family)
MCNSYTPSKGLSLLQGKCPRCQSGKIFKSNATNISKFTDMFQNCPVCDLRFEIEPGFFWGAMYVSYAMTTGMMLVLGALTFFIGHDPDFWWYVSIICGTVILSTPLLYRYARIMMLYFFSPIRFEEKYANKLK